MKPHLPITSLRETVPFRVRPSIVLFGDSITQFGYGTPESKDVGWVSLLSSAYSRRCDVFNRGFSGYNTRDAIRLIPQVFGSFPLQQISATKDLEPLNPYEGQLLFCVVFFGANDATVPGEYQHVPIDEYAENIDKIIRSIRETVNVQPTSVTSYASDFPIILLTPPPIDETAWANFRSMESSDRTNDRARNYGLRLKDVAANHKHCEVLDTWELLEGGSSAEVRGKHLCDGLHLSQSGNRLVFHGLMDQIIRKHYPYLAPSEDGDSRVNQKTGIPMEEKQWKDIYGL